LPNRWKLSGLRVRLTRNRVRLNYPDTYSYDLDGNQIQKVHTTSAGTETTTNTYNGDDELTQSVDSSTGTTTFGYDANGSQTSSTNGGNVTTNTYDVRNRLSSVTTGGVTTTYGYDDAGNRVSETTAGTTTYYLIDSNNPTGYAKPIEQWVSTTGNRSTATLSMSYVIGDRVLAQATGSGVVSYLLVDGQDNTRALTNSSGMVTATFNYDASGDPIGFNAATAPTSILFQETMFDAPSGLNFFDNGQREEQLGSPDFIEADSQMYADNQNPITLNLRLLDGADTINNIDLNGHDFGLADLIVAQGIDTTLSSLELTGFSAVAKTVAGVQAGESANQIFEGFLIDQAIQVGAIVGLAVAGKLVGGLLDGSLAASLTQEEGNVAAQEATLARSELSNSISNLGGGFAEGNAAALNEFPPGSAFSGVYNPESGRFLAYPSGRTLLADGSIPPNLVPRGGGHAIVNDVFSDLVGADPTSNLGFTLQRQEDGSFAISWLSRSVNGPNPSFVGPIVPEAMRPQVISAIENATGRTVTSVE
jgi:YD repeat-containing protein